jgi:methenyltetrahydromethanopterin cyclohydrolase
MVLGTGGMLTIAGDYPTTAIQAKQEAAWTVLSVGADSSAMGDGYTAPLAFRR